MLKLQLMIQKITLMIQILKIQLAIKLLKQKRTVPNLPKPKYIVLHHGGGDWGFYQVNNHHKNRWGFRSSLNFYLGYAYWIERYGRLYQARRDNEEAAHLVEPGKPHYWNRNALSICLQGNYEIGRPTDSSLKTLREWLEKKRKKYNIPMDRILYHGQVVPTLCCGKYLKEWLVKYKNT